MYTISTEDLKPTIQMLRKASKPFLVIGTYGIGKSEMIFQSAQEEAERTKKIFLDWNRASKDIKKDAMFNPDKYHMFVDIRISQMDEGDLRGIPLIEAINTSNTDAELKLITLGWINYITKPGASGTVFFDELNLARPSVTSSAYSIINDRVISDRAISKDVFIIAAGNKESDCDLVQPIPDPLMDRFAMAELSFNVNTWLEWAISNIDPYLYAFCKWKPDNIHRPKRGEKSVTPRGIYNASCALKNVDFSKEKDIYNAIALCVGEGFAMEFLAYYKHIASLDWKMLESNPSIVESYDIEHQYAVMGSAAAKIKEYASASEFVLVEFLEKITPFLLVVAYLPSDFVMATIKQLTNIKVTQKVKSKSTEVMLLNVICKFILFGPSKIEGISSLPKASVTKMENMQKVFNKKHAKIFSKM